MKKKLDKESQFTKRVKGRKELKKQKPALTQQELSNTAHNSSGDVGLFPLC